MTESLSTGQGYFSPPIAQKKLFPPNNQSDASSALVKAAPLARDAISRGSLPTYRNDVVKKRGVNRE